MKNEPLLAENQHSFWTRKKCGGIGTFLSFGTFAALMILKSTTKLDNFESHVVSFFAFISIITGILSVGAVCSSPNSQALAEDQITAERYRAWHGYHTV